MTEDASIGMKKPHRTLLIKEWKARAQAGSGTAATLPPPPLPAAAPSAPPPAAPPPAAAASLPPPPYTPASALPPLKLLTSEFPSALSALLCGWLLSSLWSSALPCALERLALCLALSLPCSHLLSRFTCGLLCGLLSARRFCLALLQARGCSLERICGALFEESKRER